MTFDREAGRRLLLTLGDVLDGLAVPFFLVQGTALGAVRDGDFVPTERDIDLGILIEHFAPRAGDIAKALIERNVEVETWHRHGPFRFCHTLVAYDPGRRAKADLVGYLKWKGWRFSPTPDDPVNVPEPYCLVHPAELLETYRRVELFGRSWKVPHPSDVYFEREYGPDWRTPKEDHVSRSRRYNFLAEEGIPCGDIQP